MIQYSSAASKSFIISPALAVELADEIRPVGFRGVRVLAVLELELAQHLVLGQVDLDVLTGTGVPSAALRPVPSTWATCSA